jgi:hypothetical protein
MSLPQNFDAKELFRYVIPGVLALVILLPYMSVFLPDWNVYTSVEKLSYSVFMILAFGLIIEIIVDLLAGHVVGWCCNIGLFRKVFKLCKDEPTFHVAREDRAQLLASLTVDDRDLIWRTTAIAHMLTGAAIVFFISAILSVTKIGSFLLGFSSSDGVLGAFITCCLSSLLILVSLKSAVVHAQFRHDYYSAFMKKIQTRIYAGLLGLIER